MRTKRLLPRASATLLASALLVLGLPVLTAHAAETTGKAASTSSFLGDRTAGKVTDGDQNSYWESSTAKQPQWAEVDLGAKAAVDQVVLKLPAGWKARK